ncbi:MAG: hypothetical protein ACFFG0_38330, partial [Candidatus Thorarchaeota archaeon]
MANFSNNKFNDIREIHGFAKDEIIKIKETIGKLKSEDPEGVKLNTYLKSKLHISNEILNQYSYYLGEVEVFTQDYLLSVENFDYFYLKSEILNELQVISNNLQNLSSNARNIKRIIKHNKAIEDALAIIEDLLKKSTSLGSKIQQSIKEIISIHQDLTTLWTEINRIKNLNFKLNDIPPNIEHWNEIKELVTFIVSLNDVFQNKRKKDKKERILTFHFEEIYQFFISFQCSMLGG